MKERPILFSGPMVCAILDGSKTQTRRLMKPQPVGTDGVTWPDPDRWGWAFAKGRTMIDKREARNCCPYGAKGDRLWVKETHALRADIDGATNPDKARQYTMYRADAAGDPHDPDNWHDYGSRWRPSIHMPRWASRITLEVTGVRVERLQDITEDDAQAEGIESFDGMLDEAAICARAKELGVTASESRPWFAVAWDKINGERASWASNPWVWVVEFRRLP